MRLFAFLSLASARKRGCESARKTGGGGPMISGGYQPPPLSPEVFSDHAGDQRELVE